MDHDDDHSAESSYYRRWTHKLFYFRKVKRWNSSTGMWNAQFIDTEGCQLKPILTWLDSPNPIWLRWLNCPNKTLPSRVPLANLRVLELSGCYLERLWLCKSQAPLLLRELVIDCPLAKLPENIGHLENLELMVLRNTNLKGLPESFGNLKKLKYLDLSHSPSLQKLPNSFANLKNLERLNLCCCNSLQELPDSFGDLTKLIYLDISRSFSLETLPNTFGNLRSLQHLNLSYSQSLQRLPNSFGDLAHLNHLDMSNSSSLHNLPNSFHNLIPLDYLDLSSCPNLIASREIVLNTHPSS